MHISDSIAYILITLYTFREPHTHSDNIIYIQITSFAFRELLLPFISEVTAQHKTLVLETDARRRNKCSEAKIGARRLNRRPEAKQTPEGETDAQRRSTCIKVMYNWLAYKQTSTWAVNQLPFLLRFQNQILLSDFIKCYMYRYTCTIQIFVT